MPDPKYNLSPEEAIARMRTELAEMRVTQTRELGDLAPDTAFELGYETAIHEFVRMTGPDPREIGVIIFTPKESE